ncbi:rhamnogalacturonase B [Coprinopsis cinerea AmutBmut pab1-1]|nr:rhamnogalacturonase B [Coprinopsis cinerea AmutBmut pab1-1]
MSHWGPTTFNVGSSPVSAFPMAQFKGVNNPTRVQWNANSSQIGARTLRIRTTGAFAGGRPQIYVNGRWTSHAPPGMSVLRGRASFPWLDTDTLKLHVILIPEGKGSVGL